MRDTCTGWRAALAGGVLALFAGLPTLHAQTSTRLDLGGVLQVGGEAERYLRVLQIAGEVPLHPWSMQPFAAGEVSGLTPRGDHPWRERFSNSDNGGEKGFTWLRPDARLWFNSGFPVRDMEGPAWSGRGLNAQLQWGVTGRFWRFRYQIAPVAFVNQNAGFAAAPSPFPLGDPRWAGQIDLPQRFGTGSYGRVDLGESSVQLDLPVLLLSLSNQVQRWGPGRSYALILSPNGGGFPHLTVATPHPVSIGIGRFQLRYLAGTLGQSSFSPHSADHPDRLATAIVGSFVPRWIDGLEIGAMKWTEMWMPKSVTWSQLSRPFVGGFNRNFGTDAANINIPGENGMASAFFRWVAPKAGAEIFGEIYREDYAGDFRTLLEKPDDLASIMLGVQYAIVTTPERIRVVRAEVVNGQLAHQERGQRGFSGSEPPYLHSEVVQGHTLRGQLLGAPDAYGGAGFRLAVEDFTAAGRSSWTFQRSLVMEDEPYLPSTTQVRPADVLYSLRFERMHFSGKRDYTLTIMPSYELNRYTIANNDQFNLYIAAGVRGWR